MFLSLLTGLFSTLMMTIFEFPFWRKWGLEGVLEWHENQLLYSKFFRTDRTKINFPGLFFLHFVNGGLGGIGFYFLLTLIPSLITMMFFVGILYGLVLWVLTLLPIHKPITGIDPLRHRLGLGPVITSLTGHMLYGVILSALMMTII
ncbi:MAG: hypothetical protein P0116_02030 [Candidatus Nitrosocosmicus sp.]|nr:hypothetical protein [Candidatus Nitrosocosmicus sp.]